VTNPLVRNPADPFEWSRILVSGPEAEPFLQGQLSQDLREVGPDGVWSLLLHPNSDVLTSCLVKRDGEAFTLLVPRAVSGAAHARLKRFHLRVNCTIDVAEAEHGPFDTVGEQVRSGSPGPDEFAPGLAPQSFGAAFVASTVSFTKGCFTGQELVGRLDARGSSVPWRFVRCKGPSIEAIEEVLRAKGPDGPRGVTTAVNSGDTVVALGFVHRSALGAESSFTEGDVSVEAIG
jgi:folate-binding Fe-S cluster repair protein YgfZ